MNDQTRHYRCDLRDFVSDLIDFIKDQISRAVADPLDQFAATVTASGVVPVMRERLVSEDEALWATLVLLLTPYLDGTNRDALVSLGKMSRDEFVFEATQLLERIELWRDYDAEIRARAVPAAAGNRMR